MSNQSWPGVSSLVLNEPLLWEKGRPGRSVENQLRLSAADMDGRRRGKADGHPTRRTR